MASPFDYVNPGNAPGAASYMAPNMAQQLYGMISGLPEDYFKGTQQARTLRMQQPILGPDGQPLTGQNPSDYGTILSEIIKRGGAESAASLLPTLQQAPFFDLLLQRYREQQGGEGNDYPDQERQPNLGPTHGQDPTLLKSQSQQQSETSTQGQVTMRQLLPQGMDAATMENYAKAAGARAVNGMMAADQPLSPDQVSRARNIITSNVKPASPGSLEVPTGVGGGTTPLSPTQVTQGSGAVSPPQQNLGPKPVQTISVRPPGAGDTSPNPSPGAAAMVPAQFRANPQSFADYLHGLAKQARSTGQLEGFLNKGAASKISQDTADAYDKRASQIEEELAKEKGLTETQRDVYSGATGAKQQQELDLKRGDALYKGIQGASRDYDDNMAPHVDAMTALFNSPNFSSGSGEAITTALKKVQASIPSWVPGSDPNASLPNEALRKVTAQNILNQTTQLRDEAAEIGGTAGRVFKQQIDLMEQAAQKGDNSISALRFLTELNRRMGDHLHGAAQLATDYKTRAGGPGYLDANFDNVLRNYNREHPMFTQSEMQDIRLIAPPSSPRLDTKEQAIAWARRQGLQPGEPFKLPSGRIVPAP